MPGWLITVMFLTAVNTIRTVYERLFRRPELQCDLVPKKYAGTNMPYDFRVWNVVDSDSGT